MILYFFLSEKKSSELIVMCENVQLLGCVYLFLGIKQVEENCFMNNTVFSNLRKCVESCYGCAWVIILFILFRAHCAKNIKYISVLFWFLFWFC